MKASTSATAFVFVLFPLVTIIAAAVLRGEGVGIPFLAGAALVAAGAYFGALTGPTTEKAPVPPEPV